MRFKPLVRTAPVFLVALLTVLAMLFSGSIAQAHPYASALKTTVSGGSTNVQFILNEGGAHVYIVFEDGTTNDLGTIASRGTQSFSLGGHTSYAIYVAHLGNGTPVKISNDADQWATFANGRGVAVNKNPKSTAFGRIYAGSSGTGGFGFGNKGYKPQGLFWFNPDFTSGALGTNQTPANGFFGSSGPWRIRVAPDDNLLVGDWSGNGSLYAFSPDLTSHYTIFSSSQPAGIHGDGWGTAFEVGSLAEGNLQLYVPDGGMAVPGTTPNLGPNTSPGSYNCLYRYDIGAGPIPSTGWNHPPDYAYTVGLSGIAELRPEGDVGKDGKIIAAFGRANLSNPNIQILSPDGSTYLWDSWNETGGASDPWNGSAPGAGGQVGTYCGVRVSPDGRFLASVDVNNGITVALLTNGIPDDGSIFTIPNPPTTGNSRGMDWDAADNLYVISSGQLQLRTFSLGISTTCVTSNDWTGTNGSFSLSLPNASASGTATTAIASQNHGSPIPGVFTITLNTNFLSDPLIVNYTRGGTANYTNAYTLNTNETPNGVIITPSTVTFPAGTMPGGGNWAVGIKVIPSLNVSSTNTLTVVFTVGGGPGYKAVAPVKDTVYIQNTGPQLLLLTAASSGTTMYRGVTNDYAKFVITRLGDTNVATYTVTNVSFFGTASFPGDYTANAQRLDPAGDGVLVPPAPGPTAIIIKPGDTTITCAIGSPVAHTDLNAQPVDLTIVANLTNQVSGAGSTNGLLSLEGTSYNVSKAQVTLKELDNRVGPEVVLYSNPLTNANDSVNWTLTFAGTNFGPGGLPVVIPSYVNGTTYGTNDFLVDFGHDNTSDGIAPSPVMTASNWNGVLKMTVNKSTFAPMGVNVYPQGQTFGGNYALRFNMYLSGYDNALNNPGPLSAAGREFATFGVNHYGTNCNWRPDANLPEGVMWPTNLDGVWFAADAGSGSITPADYDVITPVQVPNNGNTAATADKVSNTAAGNNGVFKHPPFDAMNVTSSTVNNPGGGEPINKWVDVDVEINNQTNVSFYINRTKVVADFANTNGYVQGTVMLGYDDPNATISDGSAFVYYSNLRVVELSPYINIQAGLQGSHANSLIAAQGSSLTLEASASFGTAPITNVWYSGTAAGVPQVALQTNSVNASTIDDTFTKTFNAITDGTNYVNVFSDAAGSVTSSVVSVEVVMTPGSQVAAEGDALASLSTTFAGATAPTNFQWYFNTSSNLATATKLANNSHVGGATTANLYLTNVVNGDAGYYWIAATNTAGGVVTEAGVLTVGPGAAVNAVITPGSQQYLWGAPVTLTVTAGGTAPFTYQWKKDGVDLTDGGNVSGATSSVLSLAAITTADAGSYTVGVTNGLGGTVGGPSVVTVFTPAPKLTSVSFAGGNVVLNFSSTNSFDTSSGFTLQSSPDLSSGIWTNTPGTYTGSGGTFQVSAPQPPGTPQMFYRLVHAN